MCADGRAPDVPFSLAVVAAGSYRYGKGSHVSRSEACGAEAQHRDAGGPPHAPPWMTEKLLCLAWGERGFFVTPPSFHFLSLRTIRFRISTHSGTSSSGRSTSSVDINETP